MAHTSLYSCVTAAALRDNMECPGFGDHKDDVYCCPSTVEQGSLFCCNVNIVAEIEEKRLQREREQFLKEELPVIVSSVLGALALSLAFVLLVCFLHKRCPLYRWKQQRKSQLAAAEAEAALYSARTSGRHSQRYAAATAASGSQQSSARSATTYATSGAPATARSTGRAFTGSGTAFRQSLGPGSCTAGAAPATHSRTQYDRALSADEPKPLLYDARPPPYSLAKHYPSTPPPRNANASSNSSGSYAHQNRTNAVLQSVSHAYKV